MIDDIPLSRPDITNAEIEMVVRTMRSGRLSIGPQQEAFEELVAQRTQRRHAVAVSSGTAALHLSLLALGVGSGDEVITTPFSFVASANCALYVGATPVFVDIDRRSLNMCPKQLEAAITDKTKAIVAVEAFGNPALMDQIQRVAARHEIPLVEDSCEALGSSLGGVPAGAFGRVGVFGFYPNKQITTGEGGMIVTDDDALADACRSMRNHGRPPTSFSPAAASAPTAPGDEPAEAASASAAGPMRHDRLGYNYRLSEIACAIGAAQMRRLGEILEKRARVAETYIRRLAGVPELILPNVETGSVMSWFVFVVRLEKSYSSSERNRIIEGMRRHDIGASDYFPCIHLQPLYKRLYGFSRGVYPVAESVSERTIALPFFGALTDDEIDLVCQTLELMISRENLRR